MARLNAFIRSVAWYKLVPSGLGGLGELIAAGGSSPDSSTYVAAAATTGRNTHDCLCSARACGIDLVDMAAMSGSTRARWFDPTSGAFRDIAVGLAHDGIALVCATRP
jgi:hypothetical protein